MPNLVAQPRRWKKKIVLLKAETAYGVDPNPTGEANWIEARNVSLTSFDLQTADRNIVMPHFGNGGKVIVSVWSKLSFDVALAPSGELGTAPKWGPIMLGGGFSETTLEDTSVTYNVVSANIGSLCAYLNIDGTLHKFGGARAEIKGKLTAKGIPILTIEMDSLYTLPVKADAPAVITKTGWAIEEAVNAVNTDKLVINGVGLAFSELTWGCGNQLSRVDLPGPQREVAIVDRTPTAQCTVVAPHLDVFNPYALAESNEVYEISNTHGSAAGKKVKTNLLAKIINVSETEIEGMVAYQLTLEPTPDAGNDEIELVCL